ncbi:Ig-like domain-containing protein, partial [Thiolapillus sp.]|uniref:Ig-like domain-containing protein n=1 Tax=Thiolapillus sp. TaxID=2017437 RepID=UPI0025F964C6
GYVEENASVSLTAGMHAFEVQFFDKWGGERLTVNWQGPGFDKTPVSEAELFRVGTVAAPVNQGPAAADDAVTIRQDQSVIIAVLANDSSPRGDALTIIAASNPAHGSVLAMGGTILYKPESGFVGKDGFVYTITDGYGLQATANVSVLVEASFTVPFSGNDYRLTAEKLVSQYYLDILKRQPSDEEVAFWVEQLNN